MSDECKITLLLKGWRQPGTQTPLRLLDQWPKRECAFQRSLLFEAPSYLAEQDSMMEATIDT